MKHTLSPITIAAVVAGLALGAAGGAFTAAGADQQKSVQARCDQRTAVRTKLRDARAERQKENVLRLDPDVWKSRSRSWTRRSRTESCRRKPGTESSTRSGSNAPNA
jgi:hypothetical protein